MLIDTEDVLICPYCNNDFLHQIHVTAFFRDREDHDGTRTDCSRFNTTVERFTNEELTSTRREMVEIFFRCENCANFPVLSFSQHKGQTNVRWYSIDESKASSIVNNSIKCMDKAL